MGERSRILKRRRRNRLFAVVVAACLVLFGALLVGINVMGTGGELVERAVAPDTATDPNPVDEFAAEELQRAVEQEAAFIASAREAAKEAAEKAEKEATSQALKPEPRAAVPTDTTMYLTIPKLGLHDIPVLEGTSEAVLSQGVGHLPGTGYPWIEGSNTYIPGHRIGYPGTSSDLVFWELPSLVAGDEVILEDSLGQTYTYRVSEVFAVTPQETWVTAPIAGRDVVTLQTCTETPYDWWTVGTKLMSSGPGSGRLIVQSDRVG